MMGSPSSTVVASPNTGFSSSPQLNNPKEEITLLKREIHDKVLYIGKKHNSQLKRKSKEYCLLYLYY